MGEDRLNPAYRDIRCLLYEWVSNRKVGEGARWVGEAVVADVVTVSLSLQRKTD